MPRRPTVVVFDVNETLFNLDALGDRIEEAGLPGSTLDLWFARTLSDGFALCATGDVPSFAQLGRIHLTRLFGSFGIDATDEDVDDVLQGFEELEAHADAEPALRRLADAGVRVVTMTNGSADITRTLLERNGLADLVEATYDVQDAGAWKPRREAYEFVAHRCGVDLAEVALVAVHSWDVHGAKRAGLTTAWVSRLEHEFVAPMEEPDIRASTLTGAAKSLLAL